MRWFDWADPGFSLAFTAAAGAVVVPLVLAALGAYLERRDKKQREILARLADSINSLLQQQEARAMLNGLRSSVERDEFDLITRRIHQMPGDVQMELQRARWSNPLQRLPVDVSGLSLDVTAVCVDSLPDRLKDSGFSLENSLKPFVVSVCSLDSTSGVRAGIYNALSCAEMRRRRPGHEFYASLAEASRGKIVAGLLHELDAGGHNPLGLNILLGSLMGLHRMRTSDKAISVDPALRGQILLALASLLHRNRLTNLSGWESNAEPGEMLTDSLSAVPAFVIAAVGLLASGDEHVEMRAIQNLAPMISGARPSEKSDPWVRMHHAGSNFWGTDLDIIRLACQNLSDCCPILWEQYGEELNEAVGVDLAMGRPDRTTDV